MVVVFTLVLFVISSIFNPIYSQRRSGRNNKRAASTGRSTKRAATSGRSTKRAASNGRTSQRAGRSTRRSATNGGGGEVRTVNNSTSRDNASLEDRIKSLEDLVALHETKLKEFEGKLLSTPAGDVASGTSANTVDCENSDYGLISFVKFSENDSWTSSKFAKLTPENCEKIKDYLTEDFKRVPPVEARTLFSVYGTGYDTLTFVGKKLKFSSFVEFWIGDYVVGTDPKQQHTFLKTTLDGSMVLYDKSNRPVILYDVVEDKFIYAPDKDLVSKKFANKEWSVLKLDGSQSWTKGYRPVYMNFYYYKNNEQGDRITENGFSFGSASLYEYEYTYDENILIMDER